MNSTLILLTLAFFSLAMAHHHHHHEEIDFENKYFELKSLKLLRELEWEIDAEQDDKILSRARRVPRARNCGSRFLKRVYSVCEDGCSGRGTNLATRCCQQPCNDLDIMAECCPSSL